ncbi:MAG: choice-of-anchor D domain-containing protein, partial [Candidatus Kapaibacterium sp.]
MQAWSNLSEYGFQPTTGEYINIGGGTQIHGPGADDDQSKALDIGFTFYFDGVPYNQFSCSSDGLIGLGPQPSTACWGNELTVPDGACFDENGSYKGFDYTLFQTPHIAPFWDDLRVPSSADREPDGSISYALIGEAPNRILVIDFNTVETFYQFGSFSSWQCRLYERTNKIEFYYDFMNPDYHPSFRSGNAGTIGLASASDNFLSVSSNYDGEIGQFNYSAQSEKPDDFFSLTDPNEQGNPALPGGTMFVFTPCQLMIDGNTDQGASAPEMSDGSPIFMNTEVMRGTTGYFQPIGIWLAGGCIDRTYIAEITGPSASEYFISPEKMTITAGDKPFFPDMQFTPAGLGERKALLTITDDHGVVQSFPLQGIGTPRIIWSGDPAQGGVPDMKDSSVLLKGMHVKRGEIGTYMPFTLTNIMEGEGQEGGAAIIYTIKGTSKGQYTIDPTETSLYGGQSSTPTITFTPTGVGLIRDTLVVDADGEIRTFPLAAFSDAPGGEFFANFTQIDSNSQFFNNQFSCSGDGAITIPINTVNIGTGPFLITGFQAFEVDTTIGQGMPRYKNLRDANGQLIPMTDYILTEQPPVTPASANQVNFPISVPQGESKTLYLTFIGQRPGKRYARAYLQTNGETTFAEDANGEMVEGLFTFNLFGRGTGARLSDQKNGRLPGSLIFPSTLIGKSSEKRMALFNTGQCPLRISMDNLRISTGDVEEFAIVELPGGAKVDKVTNDIYIAPGDSASVLIRFTPQANGSRRSTIKLHTNDSTIQIPGITEAGTYYVDLFGDSPADLAPSAPDFGVALIGGGPAEQKKGMVHLANATNIPVTITAIAINGTDAADFIPNSALPWATLPITVAPGSSVDLNMIFAPMTGTPGPRTTKVNVTLANGSQVIVQLTGEAGTRTV